MARRNAEASSRAKTRVRPRQSRGLCSRSLLGTELDPIRFPHAIEESWIEMRQDGLVERLTHRVKFLNTACIPVVREISRVSLVNKPHEFSRIVRRKPEYLPQFSSYCDA